MTVVLLGVGEVYAALIHIHTYIHRHSYNIVNAMMMMMIVHIIFCGDIKIIINKVIS